MHTHIHIHIHSHSHPRASTRVLNPFRFVPVFQPQSLASSLGENDASAVIPVSLCCFLGARCGNFPPRTCAKSLGTACFNPDSNTPGRYTPSPFPSPFPFPSAGRLCGFWLQGSSFPVSFRMFGSAALSDPWALLRFPLICLGLVLLRESSMSGILDRTQLHGPRARRQRHDIDECVR